jgi:hypothetical protein
MKLNKKIISKEKLYVNLSRLEVTRACLDLVTSSDQVQEQSYISWSNKNAGPIVMRVPRLT